MKVVIIEDEPLSQEELKDLLNKYFPEIDVVKTLSSVKEGIEWLSENTVDLLFMDIQLKDGISFEIFEHLEIKTPVIFVTAYDEYAIRAFKENSIGYLLKPIIDEDLVMAVNKFLKIKDFDSYINKINKIIPKSNENNYKNRFVLKLGAKLIVVDVTNIAYIYSCDRNNFLITKDNNKYIVDYTIENLESMLDPKFFFKVSRKCIASIEAIDEIIRYSTRSLKIVLTPQCDIDIFVSRDRVQLFLKWLDK